MFIRYRRSADGSPQAKALVYTQEEHRIDPASVDPDARRIVERLKANGHQAYIVGGAVRDMLLGRKPKDFDLVTDAHPVRIKKLFRNARIIGKRFRLVHIFFGPRIYELSTFRSIANGTVGNEFGTMDEDALRRDFTFNALYYDPEDGLVVDYVGGMKDIKARRVKPVIALKTIFREDPVRMIRGVKYAAVAGFSVPLGVRLAIRRDSGLLAGTSPSRLTEEFFKILASGNSVPIVKSLAEYRLFGYLAPAAWNAMCDGSDFKAALLRDLAVLDGIAPGLPEAGSPVPAAAAASRAAAMEAPGQAGDAAEPADGLPVRRIAVLLEHFLRAALLRRSGGLSSGPECYHAALAEARAFLEPLNPPRIDLEVAVAAIFSAEGLSPHHRPRREGAAGRRRGAGRHGKAASVAGGAPDGSEATASRGEPVAPASRGARRPRAAGTESAARKTPPAGKAPAEGADIAASPDPGQESDAPRKRRRKRRAAPSHGASPSGDPAAGRPETAAGRPEAGAGGRGTVSDRRGPGAGRQETAAGKQERGGGNQDSAPSPGPGTGAPSRP